MSNLKENNKYECQICQKKIKNRNYDIEKHNNTKKHQLALQGIPKKPMTDAEIKKRYFAKKRETMGDEKFREYRTMLMRRVRAKKRSLENNPYNQAVFELMRISKTIY